MENNIYSRTKVSVKVLDLIIVAGLAALLGVIVFLSVNGGFDIVFDSDGGSDVAPLRLRYGESIAEPEAPIKEDHVFVGWYADKDLKEKVDFSSVTVTQSATFYAAWEKENKVEQ